MFSKEKKQKIPITFGKSIFETTMAWVIENQIELMKILTFSPKKASPDFTAEV